MGRTSHHHEKTGSAALRCGAILLLVLWCAASASSVRAQMTQPANDGYDGAKVIYKADARVPLDLTFHDETGKTVKLGDFFHGKPVIVAMVYYGCPMMCGLTMNGLLEGIKPLDLTLGKDYEIVMVSFDPREDAKLGAAKRDTYIEKLGKPEAAAGWHFLTSVSDDNPRALGDALGFGYRFDPIGNQYMHQPAIYICMPDGRVSRTVPNYMFPTEMLHDSLIDAAQGKIGSRIFQFAVSCGILSYDHGSGTYVAVARNIMRIGGITTMLILGSFLALLWRYDLRKKRRADAAGIIVPS